MEKIIPITEIQAHLKKFVERVKKTKEPIIITQRGRAAAMLVNYEAYEGHMATLEEMSYPDWEKRLKRAREEHTRGEGLEQKKLEAKIRAKTKRQKR